jgi:aryl-alcohol dehydrogenase-like predicted oxidoreductase
MMDTRQTSRRAFVAQGALATTGMVAGVIGGTAAEPARRQTLNFNEKMEYRRLGRTGLMVSAICLGGHWKRVGTMLSSPFQGPGYTELDFKNVENPEFIKNRTEVVSRCIEVGINYVDACSLPETLAYGKALKGRRDKMYIGYSWSHREPRRREWRTRKKLLEGLDMSLKQAGLDHVDVWRISLPQQGVTDLGELGMIEEATVEGLSAAKKQGKARFTGVSTHNRVWLKSLIDTYPEQMEVVLFPYTAASKELPDDSVFESITKYNVGVFGIKPFADNSLFVGDSSPSSPHAAEDDRRARLAIRYILNNPAITAPIPGLINAHQVANMARAVQERRQLDQKEKAELEKAGREMWARLPSHYQWLKDWEYV